jgi:hypothetical protein
MRIIYTLCAIIVLLATVQYIKWMTGPELSYSITSTTPVGLHAWEPTGREKPYILPITQTGKLQSCIRFLNGERICE